MDLTVLNISKVKSTEEASKLMKESAVLLYIFFGIQLFMCVFAYPVLQDVEVFLVPIALLLMIVVVHRFKNRAISIVMLCYLLLELANRLYNKFTDQQPAAFILVAIVCYLSAQATYAAISIKRFSKTKQR